MAKVLVTGASGFIGWHLARALVARGDEVTCLVRTTSKVDRLRSLKVELVTGDVADRESLSAATGGKSTVYHLAALAGALRLAELYRVNEHGAGNVARECARQTSPPVLVMVSSLAAGGPAPAARPRTEDDPAGPISHYGRSKRAGELAVRRFAEGVPTTIVRPSVVFGEADRYCLPIFRTVERFGTHFAPSFTRRKLSIIHADDLAALLILAAERGERAAPSTSSEDGGDSCGCYYAAAEPHPTYHDFGRMVGEALGRRRTLVISCGPIVVWSAAAVSDLAGRIRRTPAFFSIDKAREARAGHWVCSPQKAADQLGFSVGKPLTERLRQTAHWYRQEGWLRNRLTVNA